MDTAPLVGLVQTQAVRALLAQLGAGNQQTLLDLVGQNLEVSFQGMGSQGAQLLLPGGQTLVAQGELSFAPGTQLTLKVLAEGEGALRLQIQEAKPPASPALLQPLLSGEAQPLATRLTEERPSESLLPLAQMLKQVLASVKPATPPASLPTPQVEEALAALPAELVQPLRQALGLSQEQPLAQGLHAWIESPSPAVEIRPPAEAAESVATPIPLAALAQEFTGQMRQAPAVPEAQRDFLATWFQGLLAKAEGSIAAPSGAAPQPSAALPPLFLSRLPEAVASLPPQSAGFLRQALGIPDGQPLAQGLRSWMESVLPRIQALSPETHELAQRFEVLLRQAPDLPKPQRAAIATWFRELLVSRGESPARAAGLATSPSAPSPASAAPEAKVVAVMPGRTGEITPGIAPAASEPLEEPAFWNKWVRGTVEALADPQVSPREAPFHALQAREGTAYFELPAPWLPQGVMQLWVESDAPEGGRPGDETRRVFMGLQLSNLGDTRLGLELRGGNLNVRVWTEHPERLAAQEEALVRELTETGRAVSLRILPLAAGTPSLRSMVVGNSWQGLG